MPRSCASTASRSQRIIFGAFVFEQVSEATVTIVERPWERVVVDGKPHSHGEKVCQLS